MDEFDFFETDVAEIASAALTQRTLVDTQHRLGAVLEAMPIGVVFHSAQAILYANQYTCNLLQTEAKSLFGQHILDYVREAEGEKTAELIANSFAGGGRVGNMETVILRRDKAERNVRLLAGRLPWDGNPLLQLLVQDITEQKRAENTLRILSITDELTGAFNRRHAFYEGALYLDKSREESYPVSVALIDIDHFKRINDVYGHAVGDEALVAITRTARAFLRGLRHTDSAMFARLGGEEFLMLLPGLDLAEAHDAADRFRQSVALMSLPVTGRAPLKFTVSTGVARYIISDQSFDALLSRADAALYRAKKSGRNKVVSARG